MQIRPTAFTIGLIIYSFIALFFVYTEFGIDSRRLLFDTDGGCALLCNDAEDEDEGIAVCILPDKCVMDQSDYL